VFPSNFSNCIRQVREMYDAHTIIIYAEVFFCKNVILNTNDDLFFSAGNLS